MLAAILLPAAYLFYRQHRLCVALAQEMALFKAVGGSEDVADLAPTVGAPGGPTHWIDLTPFERLAESKAVRSARPVLPPGHSARRPAADGDDIALVRREVAAADGAFEVQWDAYKTLTVLKSRPFARRALLHGRGGCARARR